MKVKSNKVKGYTEKSQTITDSTRYLPPKPSKKPMPKIAKITKKDNK